MGEKEKRVSKEADKKIVQSRPLNSEAAPLTPEAPLLTLEAKRALAEAEARRRASVAPAPKAKEVNGPKGPEPTRFGDWEKKGITSDF